MKCFFAAAIFVLFCVIYVSAENKQPGNWDGEGRTIWRRGEHELRTGGYSGQHSNGLYGRSPNSEGRINYIRRFRRQIAPIDPNKPHMLNAQITHGKGVTVIQAEGSARLWQSPNQRDQIHGMGAYGQAFFPGGRTRPSYGYGLGYVHRF